MVTAEDVRRLAITLPRTEEHLIRDQVKFRVGRIVYIAIAADEKSMGFGFPKEERAALVAAEPEKFFLPAKSDSATTGCGCGWPRSTRRSCASWSWRRGAWSSRNGSPRPTSATDAARLGAYAAHLSD
jgi:hypothetical protein